MEENENVSNQEEQDKKENKKIEVVSGDGDLNISPVSRYIEVEKPKPKEEREIIIPEVKDTVSKDNDSSN